MNIRRIWWIYYGGRGMRGTRLRGDYFSISHYELKCCFRSILYRMYYGRWKNPLIFAFWRFIWKKKLQRWREGGRQREMERSSMCWCISQMIATAGVGWSQGVETPFEPSVWVAGAKIIAPSCAAFSGARAGVWIRSGAGRTPASTSGMLASQVAA